MRPGSRPSRSFVLLGAGVTALTLLAACSSGSSSSSGTTSTSTSTTAPSTSATTASTSTSSPTSTSGGTTAPTAVPSSTRCHSSALSASLGASQGAAGSTYVPVVLTNHGSASCVIKGYPGVSLLDAGGRPIGAPATRDTSHPVTAVTLAPGAVASTIVHTLNQGVAPGGCRATSTSLQLFPPDETVALTIPARITVCGNTFTVTAIAAGNGG